MTEAPLNPWRNRIKTTEIMLGHFKVKGLYIGMQAVLALYGSERHTGLVLDIGDGVTHVVPVVEGYALPHAIKRLDLAGRDLTDWMRRLLTEVDFNRGRLLISSAEREYAREIKEQHGRVSLDYDEDVNKLESEHENQRYILPDGHEINFRSAAFRVTEPLFKPQLLGVESLGISELIHQSISECDVDTRLKLYSNIILSGGSTLFPGMKERIEKDVSALLPPEVLVHVHDQAEPKNQWHLTWKGGSKVAHLDSFKPYWFTNHEYQSQVGGSNGFPGDCRECARAIFLKKGMELLM